MHLRHGNCIFSLYALDGAFLGTMGLQRHNLKSGGSNVFGIFPNEAALQFDACHIIQFLRGVELTIRVHVATFSNLVFKYFNVPVQGRGFLDILLQPSLHRS